MGEPGRDPGGLLGREDVADTGGLDLGDALERVEQLVQLVRVPGRDEVVGVLGPRAGAHRRPRTHRYRDGHFVGR